MSESQTERNELVGTDRLRRVIPQPQFLDRPGEAPKEKGNRKTAQKGRLVKTQLALHDTSWGLQALAKRVA